MATNLRQKDLLVVGFWSDWARRRTNMRGLLTARLARTPKRGDHFDWGNYARVERQEDSNVARIAMARLERGQSTRTYAEARSRALTILL
jgi:hypothetical protein